MQIAVEPNYSQNENLGWTCTLNYRPALMQHGFHPRSLDMSAPQTHAKSAHTPSAAARRYLKSPPMLNLASIPSRWRILHMTDIQAAVI